ncbi:MAG: OHCU decarboxylase [Meiothermus sp.]
MPLTLTALNQMPREDFVNAVGWIFEGSPWVAEQSWATRPWGSVSMLHQAMCAMVEKAPIAAKLALIRAHPDLGSRAKMAEASVSEQKGAGLDSLNPDEYERIGRLNQEYTTKFGFPFIFAVKGKTKHDVFAALDARLNNSKEDELETALAEIYRIAGFRLRDAVKEDERA